MTTLPFPNFKDLDPRDWHLWFEDFDKYTAADWTITTTEAGTSSATEAVSDAANGVLLITNDVNDDDADFFNYANETWKFDSSKRLWFGARFQSGEATQSDIIIGLQDTDTTPLAASDGLWFQKDDGDTNLDFHIGASGTSTDRAAIATFAASTWTEVEFYYDGNSGGVYVGVNGSVVTTVPLTNAPSTELCVSFGIQNGSAGAKTLSVDYLFVAQER